jgi:predicted MPP superfamily phosphohydrolase
MFFLAIVSFMIVGDIAWWLWADRRLRRLPRARLWRGLVAGFAGLQLAAFFGIMLSRFYGLPGLIPASVIASAYLWHLLILPATVLSILLAGVTVLIYRSGRAVLGGSDRPATAPTAGLSRREFLSAAAVAAPPLLTGVGLGRAFFQLNDFRINRITLPIPGLPRDLDGATIAHVSDVHVGRFTRTRDLPAIAEATNKLRADLVLMTGDLIDHSLADLPAGLEMIARLDPRHGLYTIEGNHDLFESRRGFEHRVRAAGVPLLINQSRLLRVRGVDVQLLGTRWGHPLLSRGADFDGQTRQTLTLLQNGAFPILLAHHPHAFDVAAEANIPLTLSGHTHGGQLMLNERLGAGPIMFKYWSGVYRKPGGSTLVVSNGVGNWFPLRLQAPAEIVHITLRRAHT